MKIFYKALILSFLFLQVQAEEFVYGLGDVPIFKDMKSIAGSSKINKTKDTEISRILLRINFAPY